MARNFLHMKRLVELKTGANTETGRYLNEAQIQLAKYSKRVRRMEVNISNGHTLVPDNCLVVFGVNWRGIALEPWSFPDRPWENPDRSFTKEEPFYWLEEDGSLILWPGCTGVAFISYLGRPMAMEQDSDEPEMPDCEDALIAYATFMNYFDAEDEQEAYYWRQQWDAQRAQWLETDAIQNRRTFKVKHRRWR